MGPHGPKFGGGATATILHPAIVVLMVLSIVLFFVLPRKYMIVPVMVSTFLIPLGQQFVIGGVHLFVSRILLLVAFIGAYSSKPKSLYTGGWNSIDTAFTCYVMISAIATLMMYQDGAAVVNQIGYVWDFLLAYLLLRSLIRDEKDSFLTIKCFAVLMVLIAAAMVYEQMKMVNIFGLLGGAGGPGSTGWQDSLAGCVPAFLDGRNIRRHGHPAIFSPVEDARVAAGTAGQECSRLARLIPGVGFAAWHLGAVRF